MSVSKASDLIKIMSKMPNPGQQQCPKKPQSVPKGHGCSDYSFNKDK